MHFPLVNASSISLPNPFFAILALQSRLFVTLSLIARLHNRSGLTSNSFFVYPTLSLSNRPCTLGRLAVLDSWAAATDIVFRLVMQWLFTLCGLPIVRLSTTIPLVHAQLSQIALNSSFVVTSKPSNILAFLPVLAPFLPFFYKFVNINFSLYITLP